MFEYSVCLLYIGLQFYLPVVIISEKIVYLDMKAICDCRKQFYIGVSTVCFPTGDSLIGNTQSSSKIFLLSSVELTKFFDFFTKFDLHTVFLQFSVHRCAYSIVKSRMNNQ